MDENTLAIEMLQEQKERVRVRNIIIGLLIIALGCSLGYNYYLVHDIGYEEVVEETTEYIQEIDDTGDINDSYIINGGDNTWQK